MAMRHPTAKLRRTRRHYPTRRSGELDGRREMSGLPHAGSQPALEATNRYLVPPVPGTCPTTCGSERWKSGTRVEIRVPPSWQANLTVASAGRTIHALSGVP